MQGCLSVMRGCLSALFLFFIPPTLLALDWRWMTLQWQQAHIGLVLLGAVVFLCLLALFFWRCTRLERAFLRLFGVKE